MRLFAACALVCFAAAVLCGCSGDSGGGTVQSVNKTPPPPKGAMVGGYKAGPGAGGMDSQVGGKAKGSGGN
ncbi:MAG TPA: hypothetical protein VG944_22130 [Fimbriimonas sp.]|nr:hypothetical protein [Fimbriimonas sp.]